MSSEKARSGKLGEAAHALGRGEDEARRGDRARRGARHGPAPDQPQ
ncbi:MAG TPA: hypothetical protein VF535_04310 [Allosphingosinicella sp.]|jgi:hypothetical protein